MNTSINPCLHTSTGRCYECFRQLLGCRVPRSGGRSYCSERVDPLPDAMLL